MGHTLSVSFPVMSISAHWLPDLLRRSPSSPKPEVLLSGDPPALGLEPEEPELEDPPADWMQVDVKHVSGIGRLEPDQTLDSAPTNQL